MDYVLGGVSALITGNVTPSRPKNLKRALTPIKNQPSPNVTPKSQYVEDRSIFLSPTMQKKKAIVKKSPKRIFQNPDLDASNDGENNSNTSSPQTDKVKKHLKGELDCVNIPPKSPKKLNPDSTQFTKTSKTVTGESCDSKKKKKNLLKECNLNVSEETSETQKIPNKKNIKRDSLNTQSEISQTTSNLAEEAESSPKKKKKKNKKNTIKSNDDVKNTTEIACTPNTPKKKKNTINIDDNAENRPTSDANKNHCEKKKKKEISSTVIDGTETAMKSINTKQKKFKKQKLSEYKLLENVNPNAISNKDTDSEHDSDNEIDSDGEKTNKIAFKADPVESSDDDEEQKETPVKDIPVKEPVTEDEIKRTLFVGNVPLSKKCKKEIKNIFSQYGNIETVRIRTVPVKDATITPKMAVIKNELHPERTTVNVYVKFQDPASVNKALSANNTVLHDHHLRVSRSDSSGFIHDPKCAIFVGNMPFALEDEGLRTKFEKCGEIDSVRIIRDKKTNAGKGFGYVNFTSKDSVELALALTEEDLTIKNRILRVKRCTQNPTKKLAPRQGNAFGRPNYQERQMRNTFGQTNSNMRRNTPGHWNNQGSQPRNNFGQQGLSEGRNEGAYRRLMNKRKSGDGPGGPPNKRQGDINQPHREKKARKEFVGMTAEKKKKHKFDKGQKKKKALSEILTKK